MIHHSKDITLLEHQIEALHKIKNGCILNGGVGSGKTFTSLFYYLNKEYHRPLYVITTAKKRNSKDWENEAEMTGIENIVVDSWNNISKYVGIKDAFFIFDEQRSVGYGTWSKAFISLARTNRWIMLSATPGDNWMDLMSVFIANGFYKNKSDFVKNHVEYDSYVKSFPKIKGYKNTFILNKYREQILIPMIFERKTKRVRKKMLAGYDKEALKKLSTTRISPYTNDIIDNPSTFMSNLRQLIFTSPDRIRKAKFIMDIHDKMIVYYSYNYELDILKNICEELNKPYAEYNGHKHQSIPDTDKWIYLVQYTAGNDAWNCTETNAMFFYSLNYAWRVMEQCEGRIDRLNTKYDTLEYFYMSSLSPLDKSIEMALKHKKMFNESKWLRNEKLWY